MGVNLGGDLVLREESKEGESGVYSLCLIIRATVGKEGLGLAFSALVIFVYSTPARLCQYLFYPNMSERKNKKNENCSDMRDTVTAIEKIEIILHQKEISF